MNKRGHIFISGKVQGVFFRSTIRKKAKELGVNGWVKNLTDGRVEAIFEGEEEKIKKMIEFCHKGPKAANVKDVEVKWEESKNEFNDFKVKY